MPPDLTTTAGVAAVAATIITILWRAHERSDREMKVDRNYWRDLALRGTDLAEKATWHALRTPRDDG